MDRVSTFTLATLVAAAAATLAACGSSNSTGPNNAAPPDSVQQQIAQSIATSIQAEVASFTQFGAFSFFTPFTASPDRALRQGVTKLRALTHRPVPGRVRTLAFDDSCPTASPSTPADEDADGVPDLATFTYSSAHCTDTESGETVTITGSWIAGDTTPSTPDLDDNEQIQNLLLTESGSQSAFRISANGGVSIAETTGKVTADLDFWLAIQETAPEAVHDSLSEQGGLEFDFSPSGNPLIEDSQLPAGTLHIDLTESFVLGGQAYTFTIGTPTALTIDPGCPSTVTGGVVTVTFGTGTSTVETITWTGCGAYTISKA